MNLTFEELFSLPKMKDAQVLTCMDKLPGTISWFHIIEIEDMAMWVDAGMLVFMTGVGLKNVESGLLNIITSLHQKKAAGLVINQGIYISSVPNTVIQAAEEFHLPLILLPGEVKLFEVTFQLNQLFNEKQVRTKQMNQILIETLMSAPMATWDFHTVDGFDPSYAYTVCVFSCNAIQETKTGFFTKVLNAMPRVSRQNVPAIVLHGNFVFFMPFHIDVATSLQLDFVQKVASALQQSIHHLTAVPENNILIHGGVGQIAADFYALKNSYSQAYQAMKLAEKDIFPEKVLHYSKVSLFGLINMDQPETIHAFVNDCLGSLPKHPDLMATLMAYLKNDRNMSLTAQEQYIHVNSVKYRLSQIYKILPSKPENAYDWTQLHIAVLLHGIVKGSFSKSSELK